MTKEERLQYIDCALRINNIQLSKNILETALFCIDLVDKTKGKATLDKCIMKKQ